MEKIYTDTSKILKALSDPKRLRVVDMLSCGELCACVILDAFNITQPTLSHDMKVLQDANIVNSRKEWKSTFYSLNTPVLEQFNSTLNELFHAKANCICHLKCKDKNTAQ